MNTPTPAAIAFSQDGKYQMAVVGISPTVEGTYRIDGDKLMLRHKDMPAGLPDAVFTMTWNGKDALDLKPIPQVALAQPIPDDVLNELIMHMVRSSPDQQLSPDTINKLQASSSSAAATPESESMTCLSNVKQLTMGVQMYAEDYDQTLPLETWEDATKPYVKSEAVFNCPAKTKAGETGGYAFTGDITGNKISALGLPPERVPVIFDSNAPGPNALGSANDLPDPKRHSKGNVVGYVDGHATFIP